jgi:hypothetical protein
MCNFLMANFDKFIDITKSFIIVFVWDNLTKTLYNTIIYLLSTTKV